MGAGRTGSEGAIEGNGRANASLMIAGSHDQLSTQLVMVSGSYELALMRPALLDRGVEATAMRCAYVEMAC